MPPTERAFKNDKSSLVMREEDCLTGLLSVGRPVDVVVTSPPYNIGVAYSKYDDTITRGAYLGWIGRWAEAVSQALDDRGSVFLNVAGKPSDPLVPFEVLQVMTGRFALQNVIHWVKSISISKSDAGDYPNITGDISVGHFKPINSRRYINDCHEYVFHLTKRGDVELDRLAVGVPYQDKSNIGRWKHAAADRRCRGNTWFIPYPTIRDRVKDRPHPASFPARLPEMCILLHGLDRVRLVCDPFMGIGPSALAALRLGVDFIGFEIDDDYFERACASVEEELAGR